MGFPSPLSKAFLRVRWPFSRTRPTRSGKGACARSDELIKGGVFIIFTLRREGDELLIRPISARYMHKKEIEAYEKENPDL
jgi:hypothetical protein